VNFITTYRQRWGVEPICSALQVAPSTFYAALSGKPSRRSERDAELKADIERVHHENFGMIQTRKSPPDPGRLSGWTGTIYDLHLILGSSSL
jgi:putative transposase